MRRLSLPVTVILLAACRSSPVGGEGELSRSQCVDLVRRVNQLESQADEGTAEALRAGERSSIEGCLMRGTERAHRCVMQASSRKDLVDCEVHYK